MTGAGIPGPADFVPEGDGGRLRHAEELHRRVRAALVRDAPPDAGRGLAGCAAAVRVWAGGDRAQRRRTAALLLRGDRVAPAGGRDPAHDDYTAHSRTDGLLLSASRTAGPVPPGARAVLVTARHGAGGLGARAPGYEHSVLLLGPGQVPARGRSRELGGEAVVGEPGGGLELALLAARFTHGLYASVVGARLERLLDHALRAASAGTATTPARGEAATGAFLDLLVTDCLARCAARAVHFSGHWSAACAAAAGYVGVRLLTEAGYDLTTVLEEARLGSARPHRWYAHRLRTLAAPPWRDGAEVSPRAVLLARLPGCARGSGPFRGADGRLPEALFRPGAALPPLNLAGAESRPAHTAPDPLLASQAAQAARVAGAGDVGSHPGCGSTLAGLLGTLAEAADELAEACARLGTAGRLGPYARSLADRYALLVAATACTGVWWNAYAHGGPDFPAESCWLTAALHRVARHLGLGVSPEPPGPCLARVRRELLVRRAGGTGHGLWPVPRDGARLAPVAELRPAAPGG
ncbi:hypothetical protein DVA86_03395 [Streptomyces armeniacus]|uniref:Acyl-CoA dehydrogenase n=1 Tax=Streptomyces armeniacus TaxID=83291 RepID=A0A345XJL6_9ACTN|nr:hypothetical protein [Streptomyces armeniacus]AXK31832.1 hypothetical protein DVA86_03395 [Streptomyces armeniacus]